jgi:hypothetical protein
MYREVGGIDTTYEAPGFQGVVIHPHPNEQLTHASSEYESVYGKITTDWNGTPSGPFMLRVTIPANTHARILLPAIPNAKVTEGAHAIATHEERGSYELEIGSGTYEFKVSP